MAFLSGGSGGGTGSGMPPPPPPQQSAQQQQLAALAGYASNPQILEALLLQQQQAAVSSAPSSIINQLLATALLGGGSSLSPASAANSMALSSASQPLGAAASPLGQAAVTPQQQQASMLLQQLQTQLALSQLMPQMQQSAAAGGNALLNPAMAFYYQQLLQQQQQQQSLLQQLQQHQQQQHQQAQSQPSAAPTPLQMSQQHSAFQPPQQAQASATGSVESQLNAQERLMNALQHHHNQQQQPNSIGISRREEQPQQAAAVPHAAAHDRGMMPTAAAPSRNNLNPKEVHDRITRIISENEQIVQPQEILQPLLKRRPYHRQVGQQSSIEQDSNSSSTRTSPGLRDGRMLQKTQSLYEPINGVRAFGGSLTSGQPVIRQQPLTQQPHVTPICTYCHVAFPNEAGLQVHELRCSKRLEGEKAARMDVAQASSSSAFSAPPADISDNSARHPLKRRLLAAVAAEQEANMAKLARKDSGEIIVVGETKAAKDHGEHAFHVPPALPRRATVATFPVVAHSAFAVPSTTSLPPTQSQQNQQPLITAPPAPQTQLTPSFGAAHPTAFTQVVSRAAAPQPAVIVPQPTPVSVAVNSAGTTASFLPPASIKAEPKRESGEEEVHNPFSMKDLVLTGSLDRPYTLVLSEGSKMANPDTLRNARNRGRNITSETFVCMHRAQPMFVEQKGNQGNLSMYSNWHQVSVNEADSKLNLLFMGMCSPKSRTGVHPFWKYTVANREMGNYKMTHSSFWEISQKLRLRQLAEVDATPIKMEEDQTMDSKNAPTLAQKFEIKCDEIERSARSEFDAERPTSSQSFRDIEKKEPATSVPSGEDAFEFSASPPRPATAGSKKVDPVIGGHRTDEVYVYVRGRGRGRYVCDRCGIRCKKPSMLKKHIKSHTDVRPFKCRQCNFSFKTKGNLTKHLSSKTHRRKVQQGGDDSDGEDRLEIATPDDERMDESEERNGMDDGQSCSSDEEDDHMNMMDEMEDYPFKKFGQENILWERSAHTPPSRWVLFDEEINRYWPDTVTPRQCSSAPPSALPSPPKEETKFVETVPFISQMLFVSTAAPSAVATSAPLAYTAASVPPLPPKIQTQPGAMIYSFMPREESLKCEQCDRTFRKASELTLHQHTHNLEKQQSKNRMFQCPECRIPLRTKALLAKHVESSHGSHVQIDDSVTANVDPYASTQSVLGGGATPVASNPRSFMCSDCNIGFRKHGILAKHLRSKTHVMKLETLKRLPEDSLSLITKRDNGACLNEVDTTDCEKARSSLLAIVEAIRAENQRAQVAPPAAVVTSVSNLECREQLAPSPVPAIAANRAVLDSPSNGVRSYSENSSPFRSRCGSAASTAESAAARKRSDSLFRPELNSLSPAIGIANGSKLISANVWVPPKSSDLPTNGVGANRGESGQFRAVHEVVAELKHDDMEDRTMCTSPVMRILATNGHAAPAIPPGTRCSFCEVNYDSPLDLQVHLYTDHLTIRDGTFFKCPKKFCGKVYPNKNCLRTHITAHYKVDTAEVREDDNVSSASLTVVGGGAGVEDGDQRASPASDASDSSTCHSPVMLDAPRTASSVESRTPSEEPLRLPCSICAEVFTDAASLQQHWFGHVSSRTHVCQVCDAGFTSSELLQHHSATHVNKLTNGSS